MSTSFVVKLHYWRVFPYWPRHGEADGVVAATCFFAKLNQALFEQRRVQVFVPKDNVDKLTANGSARIRQEHDWPNLELRKPIPRNQFAIQGREAKRQLVFKRTDPRVRINCTNLPFVCRWKSDAARMEFLYS